MVGRLHNFLWGGTDLWKWVCQCGFEEAIQPGELPSKARMRFISHMKKDKDQPHKTLGMIDAESGEILLEGASDRRANELWEIKQYEVDGDADDPEPDPPPPPKDSPGSAGPRSTGSFVPEDDDPEDSGEDPPPLVWETPQSTRSASVESPGLDRPTASPKAGKTRAASMGKAGGAADPAKVKGFQSNLMATMTGWHFLIPAPAWGLFALGQQTLRRDDGTRFEWTPDDFQDYVWEVFRRFHEWVMPQLLGLAYGIDDQREQEIAARRIMERIMNMSRDQAARLEEQARAGDNHTLVG